MVPPQDLGSTLRPARNSHISLHSLCLQSSQWASGQPSRVCGPTRDRLLARDLCSQASEAEWLCSLGDANRNHLHSMVSCDQSRAYPVHALCSSAFARRVCCWFSPACHSRAVLG